MEIVYNLTVDERLGVMGGVYTIHKYFHLSVRDTYRGLEFPLLIPGLHSTGWDQHGKFQPTDDPSTL